VSKFFSFNVRVPSLLWYAILTIFSCYLDYIAMLTLLSW